MPRFYLISFSCWVPSLRSLSRLFRTFRHPGSQVVKFPVLFSSYNNFFYLHAAAQGHLLALIISQHYCWTTVKGKPKLAPGVYLRSCENVMRENCCGV